MNTFENKKFVSSFIAVEFLLYVLFMTLDILNSYSNISNIIKIIAISFCLITSIMIYVRYERFLDRTLLCIALSFTVLADIFLLFTDLYIIGVSCFIVVQIIYLIRFIYIKLNILRIDGRVLRMEKKHRGVFLFFTQMVLRVLLSGIVIGFLYIMKVPLDTLLFITVFYIINFITNILSVMFNFSRKHYFQGDIRLGLFLIGLILFFLCDMMVGIYNMSGYFTFSSETYRFLLQISGIGMWMFYLPGQVMITLS